MQSQNFRELIKVSKDFRESFGLLNALEAENYNQFITKYLKQLIPIESFLAQEYGFEPFFAIKDLQDFCFILPEEFTVSKSPSKSKVSEASQVQVHKMIDFQAGVFRTNGWEFDSKLKLKRGFQLPDIVRLIN